MPIAQFKVSFYYLVVNYNPDKMKMDYFLKLDDKPGKKAPGVDEYQIEYCGPNCVTADVHVVSTKT